MSVLFLSFILLMVLAPIGSMLFATLVVGSFTSKYGDNARALLKRGSIAGAICAVLAVLVFFLNPDLLLPGAGTAAILLAAFMAGFGGSAGMKLFR